MIDINICLANTHNNFTLDYLSLWIKIANFLSTLI